MMNKKRTKEIGRTKYLMFIPLAALLMIISNIETVARTTERITTDVLENVVTQLEQPLQAVQDTIVPHSGTIFEVTEVMPEFPGGMSALIEYISKNIKYPEAGKAKGIQGRVTVQFVVNQDGSISNTKILRGLSPEFDAEALRLFNSMPKWKPGMQRGQAVRVKYTCPVVFALSDGKSKVNEEAVVDANGVYRVVEIMPEFPGGMNALMGYISKNLQYPKEAQTKGLQGRAIVQVIIDAEGNVTQPKIIKGIDPLLDAEAIRLVNTMPKWTPGKEKGKNVAVRYTLPLVFKLQ